MPKTTVLLILLTIASGTNLLQADDVSPEQEAREKAFVEQMANTALTGSFTVDGNTDAPPKPERYEIESVVKAAGNLWTFNTRVKYGKTDVRLPITVPVVWAEGTPMVALTNATIPGMGSEFSARVIFHEHRYAGTWQHGKKGGHMFGMIAKTKTAKSNEAQPETKVTP